MPIGGGSSSTPADGGSGGIVEPVALVAETFDPATGAFTAVGPLGAARFGAGAVRLADGTVLVIGSVLPLPNLTGPYASSSSMEIFR